MYAVIRTGGKQYRVSPGDLLVVEKVPGEAGAEIAFEEVLMLGGEGEPTLGSPLVDGAVVRATLIETRKGDKVKVFKKIRRQGYRRTRGHRQLESVLRVIGVDGAGVNARWEGEVDLTPLSTLRLRARGLAPKVEAPLDEGGLAEGAEASAAPAKTPRAKAAAKDVKAESPLETGVVDEQAAAAAPAEVTAEVSAKPAPQPEAETVKDAGAVDEQAAAAAPADAEVAAKPVRKRKPKAEPSDPEDGADD